MKSLRDLLNTDLTGRRLDRYPELRQFEGAAQQSAALATATRAFRGRHPWMAFKPFVYVVLYVTLHVVPRMFAAWALITFLQPLVMLGFLIVVVLVEHHLGRWAVPHIRAELRDLAWRRSTNCEDCGYSLVGNTSGRCPECGVRISAEQQRLIAAQIALVSGVGPNRSA
ncbi:MAG TPA: hypothetical protein P5081_01875 [Phycisphaerae bacterium]|nr:hypothetical protein [Phycisphaerae bacterium]HRW51603.1 hypothetical protein [Phycisphaerae bacterium]